METKINKWVIDEGMESPGWFNIVCEKPEAKGKTKTLIACAIMGGEGTNSLVDPWSLGFYDENRDPIREKEFENKVSLLSYLKRYMRKH